MEHTTQSFIIVTTMLFENPGAVVIATRVHVVVVVENGRFTVHRSPQ
jgi:hypothetical protein